MKLLKLTIHNVASIEDAVIDFEHGPLSEDSRFLICGPTGAGKTTLLDAICLVLYGTTPRLHSTKNEGFVDPNENYSLSAKRTDVKIGDTRMLMRRGSLNAFVELLFTDKDDKPLKAVWNCSRARNKADGSIKVPDWSLLDASDDTVISSKRAEVPLLIEERIGLTFEQFCRTTMLAQGDFTKFLKSGENDKSEILEKLTGTAVYSEISIRIHEIKAEKDALCEQIKSKMQGVQLLSDEDLREISEQQEALRQQLKGLTDEEQYLTSVVLWFTQLDSLQKDVNESQLAYVKHQQSLQDEAWVSAGKLLADWDSTLTPQTWWKERQQAEKMVADRKAEEEHLKEKYLQLRGGWLALQQEEESIKASKLKVENYLSGEESKAECYRQMVLIQSLAQQRKETEGQIRQAHQAIQLKKNESERYIHQINELQEIVKKYSNDSTAKGNELVAASKLLEGLHYEKLLQERSSLDKQLADLKDYGLLVKSVDQLHQAATEKEAAVKAVSVQLELLAKQVAQYTQEEENIDKQVIQQEAIYEKQRLACDDLMKEYRSHLKEGEVCPLCGQTITHLSTDAHFVSVLQPVKELLESLRSQQKAAGKLLAETKAQLTANQRDLILKQKESDEADKQEREAIAQKNAHPLHTSYAFEEFPLTKVGDAYLEVKRQLQDIEAQLKNVGVQQNHLSALQKEKTVLDEALRKAENRLSELQNLLGRTQENLKAEESIIAKGQDVLKDNKQKLEVYLDWQTYVDWGDEYLSSLQKGANLYQKATDKLQLLVTRLQQLAVDMKPILQSEEAIESIHSDWKNIEVVTAVAMPQLAEHWMQLQTQVAVNRDGRLSALKQQKEATDVLTAYFAKEDAVSEERLAELAEKDADTIDALRKKLQLLREELFRLKAHFENAEKKLQEHQARIPQLEEGDTVEKVSSRQQTVKLQLNGINQQLGKLSQSLETDQKNRARFAAITRELEEANQEAERWGHLHSLFGSADGKKFRNIAQSYVLEQLLANANQYLRQFTDRYEMVCQPGSLTILLQDNEAGGVLRPTSTISGGESFLISLSLALGLSSLSRASFSMDTLFIDEGFGTLDSTFLSAVMDALERLHQMDGKRIGIISHVESLKERLTTQIQVTRVSNTLSKVKVVSLI